jgi:hypothetical protein
MYNDPEAHSIGDSFWMMDRSPTHLVVPTKRGKSHSYISPGHGHSRYVGFDKPKERIGHYRYVIEVPWILRVGIQRMSLHCWHSAKLFMLVVYG